MQRHLSLLIAVLFLMCPLLCQAAQVDRCVVGEGCPSFPCEDDQGPRPCPEDGGSCICSGAVQSPELRSAHLSPDSLPDFDGRLLASLMLPDPLHFQSGLRDGYPAQWAPWGHPLRVHALTQHFRC